MFLHHMFGEFPDDTTYKRYAHSSSDDTFSKCPFYYLNYSTFAENRKKNNEKRKNKIEIVEENDVRNKLIVF